MIAVDANGHSTSPESADDADAGPVESIRRWVLIEGDRLLLAGAIVGTTFLVLVTLEQAGIVTFGPGSAVKSLLSSGIASGLLALITVSLSINQLLLSRVFGSPADLRDRIDNTITFRERVESVADLSSSPNQPAEFLAVVGRALVEQAEHLSGRVDDDGTYGERIAAYGERIASVADVDEQSAQAHSRRASDDGSSQASSVEALSTILDSDYAHHITATRELRDDRSFDERSEFEGILELLVAIAVLRQFFKTTVIQQDLARSSRYVAYTGVLAILTTFSLTTVYTMSPVATLGPELLPWVVSAGLAVSLLPLAVLVSYLLRVATISEYTVSAGPFTPPEQAFSD